MSQFLVIDDVKNNDILHPPGCGKGLVPPTDAERDALTAAPSEMDVYPESDMEDIINEMWERELTAYHIWRRADNGKQPPILDQDGTGFCWTHSTTNAAMMDRAIANLPYVPLSAYMVGSLARDYETNYRQQGGWCGESAKFIAENGVCSQEFWPQGRIDPRLDTRDMRTNAKLHRIDEEWRDPQRPIYGQLLTPQQLMTCLINLQPCAMDDMSWGHSVCGAAPTVIERGSLGIVLLNSWANWGDNGFGVKRYENVASDGAVSIRTTTMSGDD